MKSYNTLEAIDYLLNVDNNAIFELHPEYLKKDSFTKHRFMLLQYWMGNPFLKQYREPQDTVKPNSIEEMKDLPLAPNIKWVISDLDRDYINSIIKTKGLRM